MPNHGELGTATTFGVFERRSISAALIGIPGKNGPRSSRRFALGASLEHEQPLFRSDGNHHSTGHLSTSRDRGQDRDQVARRQRSVQFGPRQKLVVDEDVDMRPRLAALVAQAHVHLRVLAGKLRQAARERPARRVASSALPPQSDRSSYGIATRTLGTVAAIIKKISQTTGPVNALEMSLIRAGYGVRHAGCYNPMPRLRMENLFAPIPDDLAEEFVQTLSPRPNLRIERIVSQGHASPPGLWYDQEQSEFVVVLAGAARLQFEEELVELKAGHSINIAAHRRHRVEWTTSDEPTIWLAVFYG